MRSDIPIYPSLSSEVSPTSSRTKIIRIAVSVLFLFTAFQVGYYLFMIEYDKVYDAYGDWNDLEQMTAWWVYYNDFWILERYIEKFGAPKVVIWGHNYEVSNRQFNATQRLSSTTYSYGFTWMSQLLQLDLSLQEKIDIIVQRLFPLCFRQASTKLIVDDVLAGHNPFDPPFEKIDGFLIHPPVDDGDVRENAVERAGRLYGPYSVNEENQYVSDQFLQLAEQYQIQTYILLTPLHPKVEKQDNFYAEILPQLEYWQAQSEQYEMVEFNPEVPTYSSSQMRDGIHLNEEGAALYTQYLIDWIWGEYEPKTIAEVTN